MDIVNLKGHPTKIIWLRTGNTKIDAIAELLLSKVDQVNEFLNNRATATGHVLKWNKWHFGTQTLYQDSLPLISHRE
ncbi:MAG: hypothetical protein IPL46_15215 [Saprospiraceae bacterium]|nr:hypothetical protein [Saprospiraceae bacterium]